MRDGLFPRFLVYQSLLAGSRGNSVEARLSHLFEKHNLSENDKALCYNILMAIQRNNIKIENILEGILENRKVDIEILLILKIGVAQHLFTTKIPDHAIVSTSAELARKIGKSSAVGFVNAIMRRIISNNEIPQSYFDDKSRISSEYSHPEWLIERWIAYYGADFAESLAKSNNLEPQLSVRANSRLITVDELNKLFLDNKLDSVIDERFPEYINLQKKIDPTRLPGYEDGLFTVQDPAFGVPVWILAPRPGEKILEIGCAPGGKLSHLAEIAGGDVELHGVDLSAERIEITRLNLSRLKLEKDVELHVSDGRSFNLGNFNAILLDAPCSSLGVIRRHPEIRYRRQLEDVSRMSQIQAELINSALAMLAPGGRLVYCSCSTEPEEGELHFTQFPERYRLGKIISGIPTEFFSGAFARTWPHLHGLDGAFSALVISEA